MPNATRETILNQLRTVYTAEDILVEPAQLMPYQSDALTAFRSLPLAAVFAQTTEQIAATVNAAVDKLPEELRTAITLREIEGMSYDEIAEVMNCPIGTVRSRIFRAREAIAAELRPLLGTTKDQRW